MIRRILGCAITVASMFLVMPATALAQSAIAGVVRDSTGAVLPGVTVEASSPALIEQVRSVVSDGQGAYQIVDLRPGVYTVTFSLTGFSSFVRERIELTTNFTAQVNGELRVGSLAETITVSGQSPLVDVQNVVSSRVATKELIATLPTTRAFQTLAVSIPGVTMGVTPRPVDLDRRGLLIHGSRHQDFAQTLDGHTMGAHNCNGGSCSGIVVNPAEVEEYSYEVAAISAETETGGPRVNVIPREGGECLSRYDVRQLHRHGPAS